MNDAVRGYERENTALHVVSDDKSWSSPFVDFFRRKPESDIQNICPISRHVCVC